MVSKSRLYGGGDTWEPNGVVPWGSTTEFSLAWYEDSGNFLTQMYAYEMAPEKVALFAGALKVGPDPTWTETALLGASLTGVDLEDTVKYTTYNILPEPVILMADLTQVKLVETVTYSTYTILPEFVTMQAELTGIESKEVVVFYTYAIPEPLSISATLTGVQLS